MKKSVFLLSACVLFSLAVVADPYAGYIYPAGIQAGTTNQFILGGQKLRQLENLCFTRSGLRVLEIVPVPGFAPPPTGQRRHLTAWLNGIACGVREEPPKPDDPRINEWRSNVWWSVLGSLNALQLSIVERYLYVPRNALQDAPSLRQMNLVTIAADADVKPGMCHFSVVNRRGLSAPHPFLVTSLRHVEEPLFCPSHRLQPPIPFVDAREKGVVLDGQVLAGETDEFRLYLAAGKPYRVKVHAHDFQPYIGDAVPGFFNAIVTIKDASGQIVATADDTARFRPDPSLVFKVPASGTYTVAIHDVLYRGRADFVYALEVNPFVPQKPKAKAALPASAASQHANGHNGIWEFRGTIARPGETDVCSFTVDRPGVRVLEVFARRFGSSLDAVLTIRQAPDAMPLAQWDDVTNRVFVGSIPQGESDPIGFYTFTKPGRYIAEITDRTGHGGGSYFWRLKIRPPRPDFSVYSARSTLPLSPWKPVKVDFEIVRREGFDGTVTLEFPNDIRARDSVATSGVDRITTFLTYKGFQPVSPKPVTLFARATINGQTLRQKVVPCDEYEQAFAWRHLVPAPSFVLRAFPAKRPPRAPRSPRKKDPTSK